MNDLCSQAITLSQNINNSSGDWYNEINELVDIILKTWDDVNPHNAFELFGSINKVISNKNKMAMLLVIATRELVGNYPNFYNEIKDNTAAHCYIKTLEDNKLSFMIHK